MLLINLKKISCFFKTVQLTEWGAQSQIPPVQLQFSLERGTPQGLPYGTKFENFICPQIVSKKAQIVEREKGENCKPNIYKDKTGFRPVSRQQQDEFRNKLFSHLSCCIFCCLLLPPFMLTFFSQLFLADFFGQLFWLFFRKTNFERAVQTFAALWSKFCRLIA